MGGRRVSQPAVIRVLGMLNVIDNAQSNSHLAVTSVRRVDMCWFYQLYIHSPSRYFLGEAVTRHLSRANLGLGDTLSVESGVKNS